MGQTVIRIGIRELEHVRVTIGDVVHEVHVSNLGAYAESIGLDSVKSDLEALEKAMTKLSDRNYHGPKIEFVYFPDRARDQHPVSF